ncbi:hypothetical protein AAW14_24235 [Streptomyces hygroscopicus]|nr:hypothetical protein [Streptomyces hygroscopicus]MCW7945028.1 hypothetical protein [Streptomyces hygroscopicus]
MVVKRPVLGGAPGGRLPADAVVSGVVDQDLPDGQEPVDVDLLGSQTQQPPGLTAAVVVAEDGEGACGGSDDVHTEPISVVFPAPFGPSSPKKAPSGISRSSPATAVKPSS